MAAMKSKKFKFTFFYMPLVPALAAAFLVACSGESTNLRDPAIITSTSKCSDLEALGNGVSCVSGRFISDAVVNLNYSCDKVNALTDVDGSFSCPKGSKVKFMILNPDDASESAKKIVLGELTVKAPASFSSQDSFFYVTPNDFGTGAINMVRLLQALNRDTVTNPELPTRRVILSDDDKKKLVALANSLSPGDFSLPYSPTDEFEPLVKPYLDSLSPVATLPSPADAQKQLNKSLFSTVAGAYFVPGAAVTGGYESSDNLYGGDLAGMRGISASSYLVAANWTLVDRRGRMLGFGMYSSGANSQPNECKFLYFSSTSPCSSGSQPVPSLLKLKPDASRWSQWRQNSEWRLEYDVKTSAGMNNGTLSVVSGIIERSAMAGSAANYEGIYKEDPPAGTTFGRWQLIGGTPAFDASSDKTSITLAKSRPIAPTLDPDLWKSGTAPGQIAFPLNVKLSFLGGCSGTGSATTCTTPLGDVYITILDDGNIVSNLHDKCGVGLDKSTLKYASGEEEYPLGMVAQIFPTNRGSRVYMSPMLMIPDADALQSPSLAHPIPALLSNVQMGTSGTSVSSGLSGQLRLRIDKGDASKYLHVYDDAAVAEDGNATDTELTAYWNNQADFLKRLPSYDGRLVSVPHSCI